MHKLCTSPGPLCNGARELALALAVVRGEAGVGGGGLNKDCPKIIQRLSKDRPKIVQRLHEIVQRWYKHFGRLHKGVQRLYTDSAGLDKDCAKMPKDNYNKK